MIGVRREGWHEMGGLLGKDRVDWDNKRTVYSSQGGSPLQHLLRGARTSADLGAPPPAPSPSHRNIAGSLVVVVISCIPTVFLA